MSVHVQRGRFKLQSCYQQLWGIIAHCVVSNHAAEWCTVSGIVLKLWTALVHMLRSARCSTLCWSYVLHWCIMHMLRNARYLALCWSSVLHWCICWVLDGIPCTVLKLCTALVLTNIDAINTWNIFFLDTFHIHTWTITSHMSMIVTCVFYGTKGVIDQQTTWLWRCPFLGSAIMTHPPYGICWPHAKSYLLRCMQNIGHGNLPLQRTFIPGLCCPFNFR